MPRDRRITLLAVCSYSFPPLEYVLNKWPEGLFLTIYTTGSNAGVTGTGVSSGAGAIEAAGVILSTVAADLGDTGNDVLHFQTTATISSVIVATSRKWIRASSFAFKFDHLLFLQFKITVQSLKIGLAAA